MPAATLCHASICDLLTAWQSTGTARHATQLVRSRSRRQRMWPGEPMCSIRACLLRYLLTLVFVYAYVVFWAAASRVWGVPLVIRLVAGAVHGAVVVTFRCTAWRPPSTAGHHATDDRAPLETCTSTCDGHATRHILHRSRLDVTCDGSSTPRR